MKRILSYVSFVLCVIMGAVFLSACGGNTTKWLRPVYTFEGDGLTIEYVTNMEKDFNFPIAGRKLDHSKFVNENILENGWVIYDTEREIVGWIESDGGYDIDGKGNCKYGFSTSYNNGVYGFSNATICVVLKSKDLTVFDRIKITTDYGSVQKVESVDNPVKGTQRYNSYDETTNTTTPDAGSENFVCCNYTLILENVDPKATDTINITLSLTE